MQRTGLLARILALAIIYFVAGKVALVLAIPPGYATAIWPATGLALAAMLVLGYRVWPGILVGSFLVNVGTTLDVSSASGVVQSLFLAISIGSGAALQALAGAYLIRRVVAMPTSLIMERDIVHLLVLGGPISCVTSALWGVTSLFVSGLIPADDFLFNLFTWWVGDSIGVLIFTPLALIVIGQPREVWRQRRFTVGIPLLATCAVAVVGFVYVSRYEENRRVDELRWTVSKMSAEVRTNVDDYVHVLHFLKGLFVSSETITQDEFRAFVEESCWRYPGIRALSWNPRVLYEERDVFEQQVRQEGLDGFQITERDDSGAVVRASCRSEYVPVKYIEPPQSNEAAIGFDILAEPIRAEALRHAGRTDQARATAPIRLVQEPGESGMLVCLPVFDATVPCNTIEERSVALRGYIVEVFVVGEIVDAALAKFRNEGIGLSIEDVNAPAHQRLIYRNDCFTNSVPTMAAAAKEFRWEQRVEIAGRIWRLTFTPSVEYMSARRSWGPWCALACGLMFASLLGCFLLILTGRNSRTEMIVNERTTELVNLNECLSHEMSQREVVQCELHRALDQMLQDKVDRDAALEALRLSEQRTRLVIDSSLDAVIIMAGTGNVVEWNSQAERLFGWTREEAIGQSLSELIIPPDCREFHLAGLRRFLKHRRGPLVNKRIEIEALYRNGEKFPVELTIAPLLTKDGYLFSAFIRDISERRRVDAEIKAARDSAEAASQAKSQFLANVSHEIRTPLSGIIGYTELLLDPDHTDESRREYVNTIQRNGEHLLLLLNDILDLSKMEAGELIVERVPCSPCEIVSDVTSLMRVRAQEKRLLFQVLYEGPIPQTILVDPMRLRQVLMNLVGNAIKFTDSGSVTLRVGMVTRAEHSEPTMRFAVIDTGIGITEEEMSRLFRPFSQADNATTRRFGGTGLGLTISKRLVEMLGGEVSVRSAPGQGSTFSFTTPTGPLEGVCMLENCHDGPSVQAIPRQALPQLKGRVLLAEDDSQLRQLLQTYLARAGADVAVAENGRVACGMLFESHAKGCPFELILLDMQMPEMDGYTAVGRIRAFGIATPVVALTAHGMAEDRAKCINAGCTDYLSKPVRRAELLTVAAGYLKSEAHRVDVQPPSVDTDDEVIAEFLPKFVEQLHETVVEIEHVLQQENVESLVQIVHKLKGGASIFGFVPISDLANHIEERLNSKHPIATIRDQVVELVAIIRRVKGYDTRQEQQVRNAIAVKAVRESL